MNRSAILSEKKQPSKGKQFIQRDKKGNRALMKSAQGRNRNPLLSPQKTMAVPSAFLTHQTQQQSTSYNLKST